MLKNKKICAMLLFLAVSLMFIQVSLHAEGPGKNIVIAAGETWGTYIPPNFDHPWPRIPVITDVASIGVNSAQASIFRSDRLVTSGLFGNPPWSWMSGRLAIDFSNGLNAVEFNPTEEFAAVNGPIVGDQYKNYAYLKFLPSVAGANDPTRNYHDPVGGAYLSAGRTHAWGTSAWPTTVGVDVKLTVHSWTMPWGHLDDFHLVEIELYNTGKPDLNADGVVDFENNRIHALNFLYRAGCFHFLINTAAGRSYYVNNNRYRGIITDLTPDENGAPWDIHCQAIGSKTTETEDHPAVTDFGEYYDAYNGYGWLGAKKWNDNAQQWEEKFLAFKNAAGEQIVPAVGEGVQRGWFRTSQPGWGGVFDGKELKAHIASMGAFYVDGGKSNDGAAFDLNPNPALFESGTAGDPTTFVVKDKSQWAYPDGAWEKTTPVMAKDPITGKELGLNPIDPTTGRGRPMEPGIITEGLISQYQFDGDPLTCIGPFSMEVGERVRIYFYRGSGFRILGLRKTVKAARAVFESIQPDGSYQVPQSPPVPEIKVSGSVNVRPLIKWQDPAALGAADGIKIYKSIAWPRYNSYDKLYPTHDTWWKTNDPNVDPGKAQINPLLRTDHEYLKEQQGDYWGPYDLVKVVTAAEYANYKNTDVDAKEYPFAWEDDTYTAPGQSYWYYVSSYKLGAATNVTPAYQNLDNVDWLESGKVNINGRTGYWEGTWPWTWRDAFYPKESDVAGKKKIGASFVLVSPTASLADLNLDRANIGVRPNPYKRAAFHDAGGKHQVMFYNLPLHCTIQIYDVSGMLIQEINYNAPFTENGTYFWDMFSKNGNEVASGLYLWVVKYDGGMQNGKFAIIR